jgi:hypothetical protein
LTGIDSITNRADVPNSGIQSGLSPKGAFFNPYQASIGGGFAFAIGDII